MSVGGGNKMSRAWVGSRGSVAHGLTVLGVLYLARGDVAQCRNGPRSHALPPVFRHNTACSV